ncbi:hypothetical protein [Flagellimonas meishanensis]|uniref:hypothetical protein n=1 Tax=Flagellimonas meishanensis TaxID=2873264 RepID=UPI001CA70B30|nr:hypothetical protein [[Muricauda] meishanensis]
MKRKLLLVLMPLFTYTIYAQESPQRISIESFSQSRGDAEESQLLEVPHSQIVVMNNSLQTSSGFGMTLNLYGSVVVVDQMERMPDGTTQLVLRREDGKDFYGFKPTIRAILSPNPQPVSETVVQE